MRCVCCLKRRQSTCRRDAAVHRRGRALRHRVHVGPRGRGAVAARAVRAVVQDRARARERHRTDARKRLRCAGSRACGIDSSPAMVAFSRARLSDAGVHAGVMLADMTNFELDSRFDAAVCPINTLSHLTEEELASHLTRVADHVEPGARYLVQVGVFDNERARRRRTNGRRSATARRFESSGRSSTATSTRAANSIARASRCSRAHGRATSSKRCTR